MSLHLTPEQARVLGSLIEKDMATPEYYPLSLNALMNACNQKSNRDPVVAYTEDVVQAALEELRAKRLSTVLSGDRVAKFGHRASETLNVNNRELAILCVLLLRGAQTVGELKTRTERLYVFDDLGSAELVLSRLAERELVVQLPRLPGTREPRWMHLLSGPVDVTPSEVPAGPATGTEAPLAARVTALEARIELLEAQFAQFRKQFE
jgi:uncharacterized protein YceH (UPF0502 family)